MREILYIIMLSLGSIIVIFILTKLMGYRQMSQMSMFDYVNGITIGSIAAEMATSLEENFVQPLTAMIVYAIAAILLSWFSSKSIKARRVIEGKPLVLMNHGELYRENLKKAKIDVTEFLTQCRISGYFDVSKLETAILEENGKISFLPKVSDRPVTPSDMNLSPEQDFMVANVILDGRIMEENLRHTGNDEKWLMNQIRGQGAGKVSDVLLATCDISNQVTVFLKNSRKEPKDILM
ncbi:YetF domain-containing protein [Blautia sp. HCP3S3_G3]|uniref:YetF domain-containing protein n=1 Tax=Blautia sp. HCP3S3_G3 TaxID=3438913 RepID=UPI003F8B87ED